MIDALRPTNINFQPLTEGTEAKIRSRMVELPDPKKKPRYCVDGRTGPRKDSQDNEMPRAPYGQALGGDLNIASIRWLLGNGKEDYLSTVNQTFADLFRAGYKQLGVHYGSHAMGESSDCGFADNNVKIMQTLGNRAHEIWEIIEQAASQYPNINLSKEKFLQLVESKVKPADLGQLPSGKTIIDHAVALENVTVQQLEASHKEVAAVVNLCPNTTLDADHNQDDAQAFNLDLWLVQQQAKDLGIDVNDATLLTLGLYVATEMVLVEEKRGVRLPILINQ